MRLKELVTVLTLVLGLSALHAGAQATPTASRPLELSTFGGITGTYTGLSSGRNLGITAGVDVGFRPFFGIRPFLEGRGTYPIDGGGIDAQKNALGGVRFSRPVFRNIDVYGDILYGRGAIKYESGGYPSLSGQYLYIRSTSNVFSPGVGAELHLTDHFSALADAQFQHWNTPATASGHIWAKALTLGVRYRFNFNRRGYATR
ncbi:MAG TPA: outer membrane beta-barrel protein [Acidobacteriaceae bacterium]|nr:outer membrane beta-barrel protein [Acidobacteriaceae bacterium]